MLNFYTVALLFFSSSIFICFTINHFLLVILLMMNTLVICIGFYFSIQKKVITIDLVYWIFNYLFFIIAVVIQSDGGYFPNNLPININYMAIGQILILLWNFIYFISRNKDNSILKSTNELSMPKNVSYLYFVFSTMIFAYVFYKNGIQYFYGYGSIVGDNTSQPIQVLVFSMVHGIVFSNFIFLYSQRKEKNLITLFLIGIAFLQLFYIVSPFNTNRFNLGFIILFFLWYFYRNTMSAYKFSVVIFLGVLVVFPFLDLFRYGFNSDFIFMFSSSFNQFEQLHFDAFPNLLASIEYTTKYGSLLGANLIGTLLFFVPSSFWEGKPEGSGIRIGNYLIDHYGFHFNNLSNPLVSEFYLAFGVVGVIVGAFLFAIIINKIEQNSMKGLGYELLYGIILSYLFILLRGSLIVAFSSIIGTIFFMIVLPHTFMMNQDRIHRKNNSKVDWG